MQPVKPEDEPEYKCTDPPILETMQIPSYSSGLSQFDDVLYNELHPFKKYV